VSELDYSIIAPIKESNKGKVCLAKVEGYEFPVIVKELIHGNSAVFRSLRALDSEYVPKIYELREDTDRLLVVEEYIEGEILSDYLNSGILSETEWLDITRQLCEALETLHRQEPPIIHRDIKPSNVIINSKGRVKLIDFDSSRLYKEDSDGDTRLLGTERYAPPEQYGYSQTDCRSDIYSLGVVFGMFPAFSSKGKQKRWKQLVEKCTLFAPESRFQSVEAVKKEVTRIASMRQRNVRFCASIGSIVFAFVVAGMLLWRFHNSNTALTGNVTPPPTSAVTLPVTGTETPPPTSAVTPPVTEPETPPPTSAPEAEDNLDEELVEIAEVYRLIAPELRDLETDVPEVAELKKEIRARRYVVEYCFKDRLSGRNFLFQEKAMERNDLKLTGLSLYSHETGKQVTIEEQYYNITDRIICIDETYMKSIKDGYYSLTAEFLEADGTSRGMSIILYVAESDWFNEPVSWLQNTTFTFYGEEEECLHLVLKNDVSTELVSLLNNYDEKPVDEALYRILQNGRVLEISNELLCQYKDYEEVEFLAVNKDGNYIDVHIDIASQE